MSNSLSNKEISDLVRADILQVLSQRGGRLDTLSAKHLTFSDYESFFFGSAQYLEREGLIVLGRSQRYSNGGGFYNSAQITAKGEALLETRPKGAADSLKAFLVDTFKDAARENITEAIKAVTLLVWTTYETWRANQQ